jgi:hypothetical protein
MKKFEELDTTVRIVMELGCVKGGQISPEPLSSLTP